MDQYNEYLAEHVLNEKEIVTYRTLSRALKVHVNLAKQMLWDFHCRQNTKKPGTVHATYLLSGKRRVKINTSIKTQDGEDTIMASSPPQPGSSMPKQDELQEKGPPTRTILLVKEKHLEKARASFVELSGIHVYSLQSEGLGDFQTLTECTRKIFSTLRTEDTQQTGKQYGTIQNAHVKRRSRKTPLPPVNVPKTTASSKGSAAVTATTKPKETPGKTENEKSAAKPASKPATLKREGSSIMASFAKNAGKPKAKPAPKPAEKDAEDTMMANMSDDDPTDDVEESKIDIKAPSGKSKQDREAELKAMMDVEDEEMEDVVEPEPEPEPEPEEPPVAQPETQTETVTVEGGRRRGRRKVMKKRTVRDEEGYLVTKEEAAWESFSEDEPAPKKAKVQAPVSTAKKNGKPGQGNIMSFFGKR